MYHSDEFLGIEFTDELYHWKYIKKERVNGKWRYYYDQSELDKYNKGLTEKTVSFTTKNGVITTKNKYEKSNNLLDGSSTSIYGKKHGDVSKTITNSQGKLSRVQAKGEKVLYDLLLKPNTTLKQGLSSLGKTINRGRKAVKKFLSRAVTTESTFTGFYGQYKHNSETGKTTKIR